MNKLIGRNLAMVLGALFVASCGSDGPAGSDASAPASTSAPASPGSSASTPAPAGPPTAQTPAPVGSPPPPPPSAPLPPVASGTRWSDPATWGGTLPPAGATVVIPPGKTILLDTATPPLKGLLIQGTLAAADADIGITSDYVYVQGGRLQIGSESAPFMRKATITLTGTTTADNAGTPGFGNKVLAVMGGILELHGRPVAQNWTKLDGGDIAAGTRQIKLARAPGWKAGDQIVIATSSLNQDEYSVSEIESVNGADVTLKTPTRFKHFGAKRQVGDVTVDVRAEVGLLSQNIVVQGDADSVTTNVGGHAMFMTGANGVTVQIANTQFQRMGQLNQLGRYPVHFHLIGSDCRSCYLRNNTVRDTIQRGIVLHDTGNLMVAGNVVFNTVGHNVIIETETTKGNTLDGNLALINRQPSPLHTEATLKTQNDRLPGNYWFRGADNAIVNNVAAGSFDNGFVYDAPGPGNFNFSNNVIHAAMAKEGVSPGDFDIVSGLMIIAGRPPGHQDRVVDTLVYHSSSGIWAEETSVPYVFDRFIVAENLVTGVQNRGVGSKAIFRNGVFIGQLPGSTVLARAGNAMHNQYGADITIENPTFAGYSDGIGFGGTDTNPAQSSYTITNARFIGANPGVGLGGDQNRMTFTDDTVRPRGFYVDATAPWLAYPGCTTAAGADAGNFRCPREPGIAELEVRLSAGAGFANKIGATLLRSDGLRYKIGAGLSSGMHSTTVLHDVADLSYALEDVSPYYALKLWDTGGDPDVIADRARTTVAVALAAAPQTVARTGDGFDTVNPPTAVNALRRAVSVVDWKANAETTYYYDGAKVWVSVGSRWVVVQQ